MSRLAQRAAVVAVHAWAATMSTAAIAQAAPTMSYTSFDATPAAPVQIGYYGSARKDCTAALTPTIRVLEPPKSGTFTVRRGLLTTNNLPGCPGLKIPAQVAFYLARPGATGADHIVYLVVNADGATAGYDVTINIKEAPKPAAPSPGSPI